MPDAAPITVSDHAVLRWLERVHGIDLTRYRDEVASAFRAGCLGHLENQQGAARMVIDVPAHHVFLLVEEGVVVTILDLRRPEPDA